MSWFQFIYTQFIFLKLMDTIFCAGRIFAFQSAESEDEKPDVPT